MAPKVKPITVAIQGGGSHGAFSWGVLDRLLQDPRLLIEGLSGTSAGAMNAVAVAHGLRVGGPDGARTALRDYWQLLQSVSQNHPLHARSLIDRLLGTYTLYNSPGYWATSWLARFMSPYQWKSPDLHDDPLYAIVTQLFDFEALRTYDAVKLFLCATHVKSGRLRVFDRTELTPAHLLASACLPTLQHAIEIDNEHYWDGGLVGNPVFFPLIYHCTTPDIIFIQLDPSLRADLPTTAPAITNRLHEITSNTSVMREMRSIAFITDLIDSGTLDPAQFKRVYMHTIKDESCFAPLDWTSKLNTEAEFLTHLYDHGVQAAEAFLSQHFDDIGQRTTAPMIEHYIGHEPHKGR